MDAELQELENDLKERKLDLALAQKSGEDRASLKEYEDLVTSQEQLIKYYKIKNGIPLAGTDAKTSTDSGESLDSQIEKINAEIVELDKQFKVAHRKKAPETILGKISQLILEKKVKLSDLETQKEEQSNDGKKRRQIEELESELESLHEEKTRIEQIIVAKEELLSKLRPEVDTGSRKYANSKISSFEDDLERLENGRVDRRQEYKKMYGIDPSDPRGVTAATVRPSRTDRPDWEW